MPSAGRLPFNGVGNNARRVFWACLTRHHLLGILTEETICVDAPYRAGWYSSINIPSLSLIKVQRSPLPSGTSFSE